MYVAGSVKLLVLVAVLKVATYKSFNVDMLLRDNSKELYWVFFLLNRINCSESGLSYFLESL